MLAADAPSAQQFAAWVTGLGGMGVGSFFFWLLMTGKLTHSREVAELKCAYEEERKLRERQFEECRRDCERWQTVAEQAVATANEVTETNKTLVESVQELTSQLPKAAGRR